MSQKLDLIREVMDIYRATYPEDTYLALCDEEKIIAQIQGEKIRMPHDIGARLDHELRGSVTEQAVKTGQRIQAERDASLFGIAYISTAVPIIEDGQVIGCLTALTSNEKLEVLRSGATELSAVVQEMASATDEIAQSSNDVAMRLQELAQWSATSTEDIRKTHSILDFVREIAVQSHLFGLNAAIEAARAGEAGRGFAVVADEIRKMADHSKKAVQEIKAQLDRVLSAVEHMNESVQAIAAVTEEHAASIEQLNSAFAQIAATAQRLAGAAQMK